MLPDPSPGLARELSDLVAERTEATEFYRELYGDITVTGIEDFRALPTVRKQDLLDEEGVSIIFDDQLDRTATRWGYTSGTSNSLAITLRSPADMTASREKFERMADLYAGERNLIVHGVPIMVNHIIPGLETTGTFFGFADASDMAYAREAVRALEPDTLWTSPSIAVDLGEKLVAAGVDTTGITRLNLGGETASQATRSRLRDLFGADVNIALFYGSSETSWLGYQCPDLEGTNGYHPFTSHHVYEILDPDEDRPADGTGEVTVTNRWMDAALPFTRYRLGDRGRIRDGDCTCGKPVLELAGRTAFESLKLAGVTVYRENLEDALDYVSDLAYPDDYQVHVREQAVDGDVLPTLEVRLVPRRDFDDSERAERQAASKLMRHFQVTNEASWQDMVAEGRFHPLTVTFTDAIAGDGVKTKPVVDHRAEE